MLTHFSEFAVRNIKRDACYFFSTPLMCAILGERSTAAFGILVSMVTETQQAKKNKNYPIIPLLHGRHAVVFELKPAHYAGSKYGN